MFDGVITSNLDETKTAAASRLYLGFRSLKCLINVEFRAENVEKRKTRGFDIPMQSIVKVQFLDALNSVAPTKMRLELITSRFATRIFAIF